MLGLYAIAIFKIDVDAPRRGERAYYRMANSECHLDTTSTAMSARQKMYRTLRGILKKSAAIADRAVLMLSCRDDVPRRSIFQGFRLSAADDDLCAEF